MKKVLESKRYPTELPIGHHPNQQALKNSPREIIDENFKYDVIYTTNQFGLRNEYKVASRLAVYAGCSMTFGVGVADNQTYPAVVHSRLGQEWSYLNIAHPGSGPDVQMANITWAIKNFKVEKLFWYMSDPHRQIVMPEKSAMSLYVPVDENILQPNKLAKRFIEINTKLEETWWQKTYWNIQTIFALCEAKGIELRMTCWQGEYDHRLKDLKEQYGVKSLGNMPALDKARDTMHPGPRTHRSFAAKILTEGFGLYTERGDLDEV
jgi:hypothetical protein